MAELLLHVTDQAAAKVWELMQEEGKPHLKLRIHVEGGGCSGFRYGFSFTEEMWEGDNEIIRPIADAAVCVLIDPMSFSYLEGAEIDYKEDISGAEFIIRNPNAATTCGCGSSFSV